ncbi:hypothetical protein [Neorhizobium alkalisoli]|uniref:Uncharacterized protein n=1 Tax=Neorhizobium alkalisoli TaxID=528178 RepID=A0A561QSL9_9HYPH|nr:hypothetical protein [Neorhizobium alkalisoli]TWF53276.1 hypothetical protein FHW37_104553 [Neorhizobium alkalisoli]
MSAVENVVRAAVQKGAAKAAEEFTTKMSPADVPQVTSKVLAEVAPVVAHVTNSEPWYQSRVTVGNYVAMASVVIGPIIGHSFSPEEQGLITAVVTGAGVMAGAAFSLYGRWVAKKPLGQ